MEEVRRTAPPVAVVGWKGDVFRTSALPSRSRSVGSQHSKLQSPMLRLGKNSASPMPETSTSAPSSVQELSKKKCIEISNKEARIKLTASKKKSESAQSPTIPALNLKITSDYNLTFQEICRRYPSTKNSLLNGFINIQPETMEDRLKIIEFLDEKKKRSTSYPKPMKRYP
ncbi:hypothetical protein AVEN_97221-1 [Araneus ventricosus]|uniref:Uncharacterized protein n=1 Tax=Araneus ventricosus TaxID=182803 RepID=A0A4Y2GCI6_ARAVE|nr:hypothetical protein AVEN_97221-1 [Araneus ventricosus]